MNEVRVNGFVRVDKRKAMQIYNNGGIIYCTPCKLRPSRETVIPVQYNRASGLTADQWFTKVMNNIRYYNCNSWSGQEIWYYVTE